MKRRGVSLIVLIITIIVVIILAAVVILTLSKNNPIESAKEARFKEDVRTFQDELALYISKQYTNAGGHWDGNISGKTYDEIVEYIPSFTKKYEGKFIINNNNIEYTNKLDEKEKEYAQNLNIQERIKLLPDEYQQVEYIESTGTQYIDTLFQANNMSTIIGKLQYFSDEFQIFGAFNRNLQLDLSIGIHKKKWFYRFGSQSINTEISNDNLIHTFKICNSGAYLDEVKICSINEETFQNNINTYLFARNTTTGNEAYCKTRMYSFEILINENNSVKNFIPCYATTTVSNVDGEICEKGTAGLYDLVEGKFYTNKGDKTKGDFVCGPEV